MSKPPSPQYDKLIRISDTPEVRPAINANWQARREIADSLRQLNSFALGADADTEQLQAIVRALQATLASVRNIPCVHGRKAQSELFAAEQKPDLLYEMSPSIGQANAVSPSMHIWREGDDENVRVYGRVTPDWAYEGPYDHLHGGIIALFFDQLLGVAQRITGSGGRTGSLSVRYHHPTPLNRPLLLTAWLKGLEGRKKFLVGELRVDDVVTASCEAVFITDKNHMAEIMAAQSGSTA